MPCLGPSDNELRREAERDRDKADDRANESKTKERLARKELDHVTALLCGLMRKLETRYEELGEISTPIVSGRIEYPGGRWLPEVDGLDEWWEKHKELDRRRQLTDDERMALGLGPTA